MLHNNPRVPSSGVKKIQKTVHEASFGYDYIGCNVLRLPEGVLVLFSMHLNYCGHKRNYQASSFLNVLAQLHSSPAPY